MESSTVLNLRERVTSIYLENLRVRVLAIDFEYTVKNFCKFTAYLVVKY